ncbi:uracil-DNA glycosylase family protein [Microbacterium sp. Leaf179]|uniref:uracil-DNA glycosylase family protein n=1 Tax=Microbacterium sp. Leaf179 TaxID=1736288 RepID=UPI00138F0917
MVVGQDPYPNPNHATGIAFSTGPQGAVSDALRAIYVNLSADPSFVTPSHGNLEEWAARGALLLNAALTLSPTSLSRRCAIWRPLLRATLAAVSATGRPIPVVLLGGKAHDLHTAVGDPTAVQAAGHPTPRNKVADRFPLFASSRPFYDANDFLTNRGEPPFDWSVM